MPPPLFDTHCHLTLGELSAQPDEVWRRARAQGVGHAVVVGIDAETSRAVQAFVRGRPGLSCSVGVHPHSAGAAQEEDFAALAGLCRAEDVVAVGETGMDLYRNRSTPAQQVASLRRHVELALDHDLPLVLHLRHAYREAAAVLEEYSGSPLRAVVHCFTGTEADLSPYVEWGYFISFSGVLTYANARGLQRAAQVVPLAQCVVETDAPWLAPEPLRGSINEPAHVVHTARKLAELRQLSFAEMAQLTTANACRLFRLPEREVLARAEDPVPEPEPGPTSRSSTRKGP